MVKNRNVQKCSACNIAVRIVSYGESCDEIPHSSNRVFALHQQFICWSRELLWGVNEHRWGSRRVLSDKR